MVFTQLVGDEDDGLSAVSLFIRGVQAPAVSSSESDHIRSSKPISPPRLRDPKGATMNNRGPMAASTPRRSVKGFRLGRVTRPEGRRIAGLKLSCFDYFSSALQSVATFLGIICGEKAVTDGPSTQRKTRCCRN
jgi:hypothetical protein